MFLLYVLSFYKKRGHYSRGDIIQGRTLFKEIQYFYFQRIRSDKFWLDRKQRDSFNLIDLGF